MSQIKQIVDKYPIVNTDWIFVDDNTSLATLEKLLFN